MFIAKTAFPIAFKSPVHEALFSQAASSPFSLFACPPGYLVKGALVEALTRQGYSIMWLRLGPEDRDPATLLLSLIQSARRLQPGFGGITLEKMKLNPGPLMGWPALYTLLAQELADGLPAASAIVLENVHHLATTQSTLGLLSSNLLAKLPNSLVQILTTYQDLPPSILSMPANYYNASDLRIDYQTSLALAEAYQADLSNECLRKALKLVEGRGVTLAGVLESCQELGLGFIQGIILHSKNVNQLLTLVTRAGLAEASEDEICALMLALNLDYCHPELSKAALGSPAIPHGPCLQVLSDGWLRLLYAWRSPLQAAFLGEHRVMKEANLLSLAEYLAHLGAVENAVELCFTQKYHPIAARLMANAAEEMMDLGQWVTLDGWLKQLPEDVLQEWPRLVYTKGEIAAARGHIAEARRTFAISSNLFSGRGELEEACQSLLAESTLAAWEGDKSIARNYARSASALAHKAGLNDKMGDINWQLASLAAASDTFEEALAYLIQASETLTDPALVGLFHRTKTLLQHQIDLQGQRRSQYQSYLETVQAEQGNLESLRWLINSPALNLPEVFARRGWSNTPLLLKMAAPLQFPENLDDETRPTFLGRLLQALSLSRSAGVSSEASIFYVPTSESRHSPEIIKSTDSELELPPLPFQSGVSEPVPGKLSSSHLEKLGVEILSTHQTGPIRLASEDTYPTSLTGPPHQKERTMNADLPDGEISSVIPIHKDDPSEKSNQNTPGLAVYCLGTFRFFLDDLLVNDWNSLKAQSIFKYLITHHSHPISKDFLMDVFWQGADVEAARRNLHQAIYSLRETLKRGSSDFKFVIFQNESYSLNPEMQLWIDCEEFEKVIQIGRQREKLGEIAEAMVQYSIAEGLYQGDFLEEELYEDWTNEHRVYLRALYLEISDKLSAYYFQREDIASAVTLCHKIIAKDNCYESAHRRLMQCYLARGQRHLAIRQYQTLKFILQEELNLLPSKETIALYKQIGLNEE